MEWREKGRWLPFGVLAWLAVTVGAGALSEPNSVATLSQVLHDFVPFALLLLPPAAGFLHASFRLSGRFAGIDAFRATRPLGDGELAHGILLAAARAWVAASLATVAGVAALAVAIWGLGDRDGVAALGRGVAVALAEIGSARVALLALLLLAAGWAALGLVAAVSLCGRNWLSLLAFLLPLVGVSVLLIANIAGFVLLPYVGPAVVAPLGVFLPLGAAAAWTFAVRGHLLPLRFAWLAALVWGASAVLLARPLAGWCATLLAGGGPQPRWLLLAAPGLAAAVLLPPALAPLAVRWNRHR
jgi:hypothetical protein